MWLNSWLSTEEAIPYEKLQEQIKLCFEIVIKVRRKDVNNDTVKWYREFQKAVNLIQKIHIRHQGV